MDTGSAGIKSIRGNRYFQTYTDGKKYSQFYPVKLKSDLHTTVHEFVHDLGAIPETLVSDNAPDEIKGNFEKETKYWRINQLKTEPGSPWQNRAEDGSW